MTPEERKFRATDARQLLENPLFIEAFGAVEKHLNMAALSCDPDNAGNAQRIVISQQLLAGVKREIQRIVTDGAVAQVQMHELESKQRFSLFKR